MTTGFKRIIFCLLAFSINLFCQTEITILSENVGTEIDEHENRFYRVFPKEKGLVNAQIIKVDEKKYRIDIVKEINNKITKVNRYIKQTDFDQLKIKIDAQPILTEALIAAMYDGMDFLRAEKIINEIPKPQYVILRYSNNKKLKGTLFKVEDNLLYIQTATSIEKVSLDVLDKMSYRQAIDDFDKLKIKIDAQPILTVALIAAMYDGMDFLRAEKIINEIPKPQYVILRYSNNKKLKGTLFKVEDNLLYIQTATSIEKVSLDALDKMSYRETINDFDSLRPYAFLMTGLSGFMMASLYNSQRPIIYNDSGIPRNDIGAYRQIFGTVIGLIFSSEVFDAISTLLTPTETIILSEAEYEKENF